MKAEKEKAKELIEKYDEILTYLESKSKSKQCALIAVDEVQQLIKNLSSDTNRFIYIVNEINYWQEVKKEIEKL